MKLLLSLLLTFEFISCLTCSNLPINTVCGPSFGGFPVANKTAEDFSNELLSMVANDTSLASELVKKSICKAPGIYTAVQSLRYQVSFQCAYFVNQAIIAGCPIPSNTQQPNGPLLCPTQCQAAASAVQALASNTEICPDGKQIDVSSYSAYCNNVNTLLPKNQNLCTIGSMAEVKFCGFPSASIAFSQCASLSDDACCKAFLASSTTSDNDLAVILASVFSSIFVIVLLICAFYFYKKHKRQAEMKKNRNSMLERKETKSKKQPSAPKKKETETKNRSSLLKQDAKNRSSLLREEIKIDVDSTGPDFYAKPPPLSFQSLKLPSIVQDSRFSELYSVAQAKDKKSEAPQSSVLVTSTSKQQEKLANIEDMPQGTKRMKVVHPYESTLDDELTIHLGNEIFVVQEFDDGWALGVDPTTGAKGAFPMVCVEDISSKSKLKSKSLNLDRDSISIRNSSTIIKKIHSTDFTKSKRPFSEFLHQLDQYESAETNANTKNYHR